MKPRLAIIVGHSKLKSGSRSAFPSLKSEYEFNSDLALDIFVEAQSRGLEARVFFRDDRTIAATGEAVTEWAKDGGVAIELHCNSFDGKATGTETLFDSDPKDSEEFAKIIHKKVISVFGVNHRKDRGVLHRSTKDLDLSNDRGAVNLESVRVPSCLVEPVFWDNPNEARLLVERKGDYVKALVSGVCDWYLKKGV